MNRQVGAFLSALLHAAGCASNRNSSSSWLSALVSWPSALSRMKYLRRPRRPYRTSTFALQHTFQRQTYELLHMTSDVLADSEAERERNPCCFTNVIQ